MRRFTILLILVLLPLTLAPRTARRPAPTAGQLTSTYTVRDAADPGGVVQIQVRALNGTGSDLRTGKVRVSSTGSTLTLLGSSHGCDLDAATQGWDVLCTVNVPAGKSRIVNVVLRAPSTGPGAISTSYNPS